MNAILADVFALYMDQERPRAMSGLHFRDYHLPLLYEQAERIFEMADSIAERIRTVGGPTLKSIGHIARSQRLLDNEATTLSRWTCSPNCASTTRRLPPACANAITCAKSIATSLLRLIQVWIDETEHRTRSLFEASRQGGATGIDVLEIIIVADGHFAFFANTHWTR